MPTGTFVAKPVVGPNGEKWAGRGRKPKWMKALDTPAVKSEETKAEPTVSSQV